MKTQYKILFIIAIFYSMLQASETLANIVNRNIIRCSASQNGWKYACDVNEKIALRGYFETNIKLSYEYKGCSDEPKNYLNIVIKTDLGERHTLNFPGKGTIDFNVFNTYDISDNTSFRDYKKISDSCSLIISSISSAPSQNTKRILSELDALIDKVNDELEIRTKNLFSSYALLISAIDSPNSLFCFIRGYDDPTYYENEIFLDLVKRFDQASPVSYNDLVKQRSDKFCKNNEPLDIKEILKQNLIQCEEDVNSNHFCSQLIVYAAQLEWFDEKIISLSDKRFEALNTFDSYIERGEALLQLKEKLKPLEKNGGEL